MPSAPAPMVSPTPLMKSRREGLPLDFMLCLRWAPSWEADRVSGASQWWQAENAHRAVLAKPIRSIRLGKDVLVAKRVPSAETPGKRRFSSLARFTQEQ